MNLKDIKEIKKNLKDSIALLEIADAKESEQEEILKKALNREAHLLNENEAIKKELEAAQKAISEKDDLLAKAKYYLESAMKDITELQKMNAELRAEVVKLRKYTSEDKKPAKRAVSGFRIKEE